MLNGKTSSMNIGFFWNKCIQFHYIEMKVLIVKVPIYRSHWKIYFFIKKLTLSIKGLSCLLEETEQFWTLWR